MNLVWGYKLKYVHKTIDCDVEWISYGLLKLKLKGVTLAK
jgi:hypothetical protein